MTTSYVHLLGGRSLDTAYGLLNATGTNVEEATAASVAGQLQTILGDQYTVVNHAYAGRVLEHVQEQIVVQPSTTERQRVYQDAREIGSKFGKTTIQPLEDFKRRVSQEGAATHYVVLSNFIDSSYFNKVLGEIGRNRTIRPILATPLLNGNSSVMLEAARKCGIFYAVIIFSIIAATVALAVAFIARKINRFISGPLCLIGLCLSAVIYFGPFANKFVRGIFSKQPLEITTTIFIAESIGSSLVDKARENKIPVLDVANTLNSFPNHYIQDHDFPNQEGSRLIAEGIAAIVRDGTPGVYSKPSASGDYHMTPYPAFYEWQVNRLVKV